MLPLSFIILYCLLHTLLSSINGATNILNVTLPHQLPNPEAVVEDVKRRVNESIWRSRRALSSSSSSSPNSQSQSQCLTGNPIDDCWRCDANWAADRTRLADCAVGFGRSAGGGKSGRIYVVTDSSDHDTVDPTPGTLRHAVIQDEPLWIVFKSDMTIKLKHELIMNSYKTIDGRGAYVQITGNGCITLQYVSNVIIHNVRVYDCRPSGNTNIRSSLTHVGYRGKSDGDGISIFGSKDIWIDHCSLSSCTDGLVDMIMGSTGITVSNTFFSHHNEVMLLGHDDKYLPDSGMQVTLAFNRFGEGLVQRMPRVRRGYVHVVNNDFYEWKMYAIGGSASPTVYSVGNRYTAPADPSAKEVTRREDTSEGEWSDWNWRTEGDIMVNGAFFVPSGQGASRESTDSSSFEPKSATLIDQLTMNVGVLGGPRDKNGGSYGEGGGTSTPSGGNDSGSSGGGGGGGGDDYFGMIFGSGASQIPLLPSNIMILFALTVMILCITTNNGDLQ